MTHQSDDITSFQIVTAGLLALVAGIPFALMVGGLIPFLAVQPVVTGLSIAGITCFGACAIILAFNFGCDITERRDEPTDDRARFHR